MNTNNNVRFFIDKLRTSIQPTHTPPAQHSAHKYVEAKTRTTPITSNHKTKTTNTPHDNNHPSRGATIIIISKAILIGMTTMGWSGIKMTICHIRIKINS